uniref:Uncharacterized protein n=1 Tax=Arundo donax TaxID=35708 RepID=A0A0A8Z482_ARUDO
MNLSSAFSFIKYFEPYDFDFCQLLKS